MLKSSVTTGRVSNGLEFRRFWDMLCVHRHRIMLLYSAMMQTEQVAETLDSQHPNDTAGRARTFPLVCITCQLCSSQLKP